MTKKFKNKKPKKKEGELLDMMISIMVYLFGTIFALFVGAGKGAVKEVMAFMERQSKKK